MSNDITISEFLTALKENTVALKENTAALSGSAPKSTKSVPAEDKAPEKSTPEKAKPSADTGAKTEKPKTGKVSKYVGEDGVKVMRDEMADFVSSGKTEAERDIRGALVKNAVVPSFVTEGAPKVTVLHVADGLRDQMMGILKTGAAQDVLAVLLKEPVNVALWNTFLKENPRPFTLAGYEATKAWLAEVSAPKVEDADDSEDGEDEDDDF